jgi:hypothetical protein
MQLRPRAITIPILVSSEPAAVRSGPRRREVAISRRLKILLWVYIAQALTGSVVGFAVPFLYYFGVL